MAASRPNTYKKYRNVLLLAVVGRGRRGGFFFPLHETTVVFLPPPLRLFGMSEFPFPHPRRRSSFVAAIAAHSSSFVFSFVVRRVLLFRFFIVPPYSILLFGRRRSSSFQGNKSSAAWPHTRAPAARPIRALLRPMPRHFQKCILCGSRYILCRCLRHV